MDGVPGGTPLSPRDLSLAARVDVLRAAGVCSLKVEGRMKNPAWVRSAVSLLRRAIDEGPGPGPVDRTDRRVVEQPRAGPTLQLRPRPELTRGAGAAADDKSFPGVRDVEALLKRPGSTERLGGFRTRLGNIEFFLPVP